jgi:hypothetical protein
MPICDRNQKREQRAIPVGMHGRAARKKLLVALTMEGKFAGEGLQNID